MLQFDYGGLWWIVVVLLFLSALHRFEFHQEKLLVILGIGHNIFGQCTEECIQEIAVNQMDQAE